MRYNAVLLELPNVKVKRCTVINPAILLPTAVDGEPHDCVAVITSACSPRPWGVVHDFGQIWKNRDFLTSTGKSIAHHELVSALLDAVSLPKQTAVCKCEAHTNSTDPISLGNALLKLNVSAVNYGGTAVRFWNVTKVSQQEIYQPVMSTNPKSQRGVVCFSRNCAVAADHFLGTSACAQTVVATCGVIWDRNMDNCKGATPHVATLNLTNTVSLN